jgi:hypothetical protein
MTDALILSTAAFVIYRLPARDMVTEPDDSGRTWREWMKAVGAGQGGIILKIPAATIAAAGLRPGISGKLSRSVL